MCISGDARKSKVTFLLFSHLSKGYLFSIAKENIACYFCYFNQDGSSEKGKEDVSPLFVHLLSCGKN